MFWLSHHPPEEHGRTFRMGSVRVCARCLGTYPVMLLAIGLQQSWHAPLSSAFDPWGAVGLLLPALIDWSWGRFRPAAGSNLFRTLTGVLLGLALGRTLFVHFHQPFPFWLRVQGALVVAVAVPVLLLRKKDLERERRAPPRTGDDTPRQP